MPVDIRDWLMKLISRWTTPIGDFSMAGTRVRGTRMNTDEGWIDTDKSAPQASSPFRSMLLDSTDECLRRSSVLIRDYLRSSVFRLS
jgi:hypothetical protein